GDRVAQPALLARDPVADPVRAAAVSAEQAEPRERPDRLGRLTRPRGLDHGAASGHSVLAQDLEVRLLDLHRQPGDLPRIALTRPHITLERPRIALQRPRITLERCDRRVRIPAPDRIRQPSDPAAVAVDPVEDDDPIPDPVAVPIPDPARSCRAGRLLSRDLHPGD